jgi:hypothetical protein
MTTLIRPQPGIPPADYPAHVERILASPSRPKVRGWLLWALVVVAALAAFALTDGAQLADVQTEGLQ